MELTPWDEEREGFQFEQVKPEVSVQYSRRDGGDVHHSTALMLRCANLIREARDHFQRNFKHGIIARDGVELNYEFS